MTTPNNDTHLGRAAKYGTVQASQQEQAAAMPGAPPEIGDLYVKTEAPEHASMFTKVVGTAGTAYDQLLPQSPSRRRATVLALDEPVVLCSSRELAQDPRNPATAAGLPAGGFVLPAGIPVVVEARGLVWVAATSATAGRVSVIVESYEQDA